MSEELKPFKLPFWALDDYPCDIFDSTEGKGLVLQVRGWGRLSSSMGDREAVKVQDRVAREILRRVNKFDELQSRLDKITELCNVGSTEELKPCPRCNGRATVHDDNPNGYTMCMTLGCLIDADSPSQWNSRPIENELQARLDKIAELCNVGSSDDFTLERIEQIEQIAKGKDLGDE